MTEVRAAVDGSPGALPPRGQSVVVAGASGQVGDILLPALCRLGYGVHALSRVPRRSDPAVQWYPGDLTQGGAVRAAAADCAAAVHLAPIWLLAPHLDDLADAGVRRVVAFGSTSLFGKAASADPRERALVGRLAQAEDASMEAAQRLGLDLIVLRPTLIYGTGRDRNIASIARFVKRFGFFPVAGKACGLRQPVHAADLANAVIALLEAPITGVRSYNLGGGETLSYRQMVERIFAALGRRPRVLRLPLAPLRLALGAVSLLPRYRYLGPGMADRMNQDLVYDHTDAERDFGYRPGPFRP